MSEALGTVVICEQCEDATFLISGTPEEMLARLDQIGWAPYGTGVTPFASENANAGRFSCPRCTSELVDQRLRRIANDVITELGISNGWLVIRSAESSIDYLRLITPEGSIQIEFEHFQTDREMREALRESIVSGLGLEN